MEALLAGELPLRTLALFALAAGIVLLLWAIVGRQIKVWQVVLPLITGKLKRGLVLFIAFCLIGLGVWLILPPPPPTTLNVLTGIGHEEFKVFRELTEQFERKYGVTVKVENATPETALRRLGEERFDLITFDVNARYELGRSGLLEELSEEKYKGLIPSSVIPELLEHLEVDGKRYFAPYRPNALLVFLNKERFDEMGIEYPKTWWDVKEIAKKFYERDGEARVVIRAEDGVIPLTLLEVIRSAGGSPRDLLNPQSKEALEFIRQLYPYVSPKSAQVNWQTACGFLLTDDVYLARNWSFSISVMRQAGREADFKIYSGWSWSSDSKPSNLLGGEFLALPKNAPHKEKAIELMRFLMSREVQVKLATELSWPVMRMDALGGLPPWLQSHYRAINASLAYAEPVPDYWSPEMADIYRRMFHEIISLEPDADIEDTLASFQAEIDALTTRQR